MAENVYQGYLIRVLKRLFPGIEILKLDPGYRQGIPDLLLLFENRWAMLEVKQSEKARERPNQRYYRDKFDNMSFCAFIYPENEEDVFRDLQQTFRPSRRRRSRVSES